MKRFSSFMLLLFGIVLLGIYASWFLQKEIIAGDWPYFYPEMLSEFHLIAPLWRSQEGIGLGGINPNYPFFSYQNAIVDIFVNFLHLPWPFVYKIFWFGSFIIFSIISIRSLLGVVLKQIAPWQVAVGAFIYLSNTYILMIVGGGQMGIALAYSIAPLVLTRFIKLIRFLSLQPLNFQFPISNFQFVILAGLAFALQVLFDIRIAYITLIIIGFYSLFYYFFIKKFNIIHTSYFILLTSIVVVGLHSYWLIPFTIFHLFFIPQGLTSPLGFEFFSFADFSHALSLLHPNWPENIFGKTYFLKPEFLLLPILAYASLLFIGKHGYIDTWLHGQKKSNLTMQQFNHAAILFFALLGLLGAFLGKGTNPPFGEVNSFLFAYIPGMNWFRDPTKFYLMTTLSYSVLIPFSLTRMLAWIATHNKFSIFNFKFVRFQRRNKLRLFSIKSQVFNIQNTFLLFAVCYLLFLIRSAWMGELGGTFKSYSVPEEYLELKEFVLGQPGFFRTLWVPTQSRFRVQSDLHPLINANTLFKSSSVSAMVQTLHKDETRELLEKLAVKYIIIPFDATGEIFLEDRKYDSVKREEMEKALDNIGYLQVVKKGQITVYETPYFRDHFWLDEGGNVSFARYSSAEYDVGVSLDKTSILVFSEQFHPQWKARFEDMTIPSVKTNEGLNSFSLPQGKYTVQVFFEPQRYMIYTYLSSFIFLLFLIMYIVRTKRNRYEQS